MFGRVLIANRGEIACRIIATCRRLGIGTVAVYSDADAGARHVRLADTALRIGPPPAGKSYLDGNAILEAARQSGAEAIHPGYGFLSENADFAEAVAAAGLVFIGPPPAAIRAMGAKDTAKALMEKTGVPVVPGYTGAAQDPETLADAAARIGYPVLIKAVAGGGGRGMRRVAHPRDFPEMLASARREAEAAFGNGAVLIERWISAPRHIEVQVLGDSQGGAVHLFERDCSLQRRHQKVIEEAPAPDMTAEMRAAMTSAALEAARAVGYVGAGTVEFIADGSRGLNPDRFWFLEMNTRLQVEHPVTEAVTGIDLVEWQLRIATGEPLPRTQEEIWLDGHAVEARLYAEDPARDFLPAPGRVTAFDPPPGLRAESGIEAGDAIPPDYDPMIAKLISHRPTRETAWGALASGLEATRLAGVASNLGFLARLVRDADVRAGRIDTGLIEARGAALSTPAPADPVIRALAALAVAGLVPLPADPHAGFALWNRLRHPIRVRSGDDVATVQISVLGRDLVEIDGDQLSLFEYDDGRVGLSDGQRDRRLGLVQDAAGVTVFDRGFGHRFVRAARVGDTDAAPASGEIRAPMPGLLRAVTVLAGDHVATGDSLAVLEAMKMEHVLRAPRDGRVAEVAGTVGATMEEGGLILRLVPEDGDG